MIAAATGVAMARSADIRQAVGVELPVYSKMSPQRTFAPAFTAYVISIFALTLPVQARSLVWDVYVTVGGATVSDVVILADGSSGQFASGLGLVTVTTSGGQMTTSISIPGAGDTGPCVLSAARPIFFNGTQKTTSGPLSGGGEECIGRSGNFTARAADAPNDFVMSAVPSNVQIFREGKQIYTGIVNMVLGDGIRIVTGAGGSFTAQNSLGTYFTLGPNTELQLGSTPPPASFSEILFGYLKRGFIEWISGHDESCSPPCPRVRTKSVSMGVRGTRFTVTASESAGTFTTTVAVQEGAVDLTNTVTGTVEPVAAGQAATVALPENLNAAVLPYARSIVTGTPATAFATIINAGATPATSCAPEMPPGIDSTFRYQTTNAANQLTGTPNTPADIPPGGSQSYVFGITPGGTLPGVEIELWFRCAGSLPAAIRPGVNTMILSAGPLPSPDLIAIAATPSGDGIVRLPGPTGSGFLAAAALNIGAAATGMAATVDTGGSALGLTVATCRTNPSTGACLAPPVEGPVTFDAGADEVMTFTTFVTATGNIPFDPAANRLFLRLKDGAGVVRGATSVAVTTQP